MGFTHCMFNLSNLCVGGKMGNVVLPLVHTIHNYREVLLRICFGLHAMFIVLLTFCPAKYQWFKSQVLNVVQNFVFFSLRKRILTIAE